MLCRSFAFESLDGEAPADAAAPLIAAAIGICLIVRVALGAVRLGLVSFSRSTGTGVIGTGHVMPHSLVKPPLQPSEEAL